MYILSPVVLIRYSPRNSLLLVLMSSILLLNCKSFRPPNGNQVSNPVNLQNARTTLRERICINQGWKFMRYTNEPDGLIYDERPEVTDRNDNIVADSKPTESVSVNSSQKTLKKWILP